MTVVLFGIFVALFLLRVPIAFALASATIIMFLFFTDFAPEALAQQVFTALDSSTLMAIVGFVFAGIILAKGGIAKYIVESLKTWVGHLPGGLALCTVIACMIFAALSGSSPATAAAIGAVMIPAMVEAGYSKQYSMGLVAASGTLGILIPPSNPLIIYGVISEKSVGNLFMAGLLPGILLGLVLCVSAIFHAKRSGFRRLPKATWNTRFKTTKKGLWGFILPIFIIGSIYTGIATPTEAAVISVVYALVISIFVYKELRWKDVRPILSETVNISSMIFMLISAAMIFGMYLTINQVPQGVAQWIIGNQFGIILFMVFVNLMLFIMGTFLDSIAIILITLPIFLPILGIMGIDVYHFAIIMVINMELAMITPPVGLNLFVISGITKEPIEKVARAVVPFLILMIVVLVVVILWPELSLILIE
jgi:C4-dicarboxylate transporter DctM subunit